MLGVNGYIMTFELRILLLNHSLIVLKEYLEVSFRFLMFKSSPLTCIVGDILPFQVNIFMVLFLYTITRNFSHVNFHFLKQQKKSPWTTNTQTDIFLLLFLCTKCCWFLILIWGMKE